MGALSLGVEVDESRGGELPPGRVGTDLTEEGSVSQGGPRGGRLRAAEGRARVREATREVAAGGLAASREQPGCGRAQRAGQLLRRCRVKGRGVKASAQGGQVWGWGHALCALDSAVLPQTPTRVTPPDAASEVTGLQAGVYHGRPTQRLCPLPSWSNQLAGHPVGCPLPSAPAAPTTFHGGTHPLRPGCHIAKCLLLQGALLLWEWLGLLTIPRPLEGAEEGFAQRGLQESPPSPGNKRSYLVVSPQNQLPSTHQVRQAPQALSSFPVALPAPLLIRGKISPANTGQPPGCSPDSI